MLHLSYIALHLALISAGTYFMADMANLALESQLESLLDKTSQMPKAVKQAKALEGQQRSGDYRIIVKKNIFNSASVSQVAIPISNNQQASSAAPVRNLPPLNLILIGTAVTEGITPYAIIKDPKEKQQALYRKGEIIGALKGNPFEGNQAKILRIDRNKVVLLRGGRQEILEVKIESKKNKRAKAGRARKGSKAGSSMDTVHQVSDNQWLLDRRELDDALKNLPQLLTKARVIPSFKDGKPDGFRIFAIVKNSLYAKIGLQNGDILQRINNVDVKSPQNFMKVLEQLKDADNISVDLVRNNTKETFSYDIR